MLETEKTHQFVHAQMELMTLKKKYVQIVPNNVKNVQIFQHVQFVHLDMDHHQIVHLSQFHRVLKSEMYQ